jgi:opacity protein-like surface antigen
MRKMFMILLWIAVAAIPAMAQETPRREFFMGYGYVRPEGGKANLSGWHASFASNVNSWVGLAVELNGEYGTQTLSVTGSNGQPASVKSRVDFHSLAFGPRFTYRRSEAFTPFAHVLVGAARGNWKSPASVAGEETTLGIAAGGGLDTKVANKVSLRMIQAEWVRTRFGSSSQDALRIATGVLFSF